MTAAAGILMTSIVLLFILLKPVRSIFGVISYGSLALLVSYALSVRLIFIQQRTLQKSLPPEAEEVHAELAEKSSLQRDAITYILGAAVIFAVVPFLTQAAGQIADLSGLGKTFIGTTMVAFTTSLPEVATTLIAVRMRAFDLAVGNIFGSNAFNMIILVAVDVFYNQPLYANVQSHHAVTAAWVILVTMVAIMGLLYQEEKRYWIFEPDAALIILLVAGAMLTVYLLS
jgi:cation:H+ antiporter